MQLVPFAAVLKRKLKLSNNTLQLSFQPEQLSNGAFSFTAGQFIQFIFEIDGTNL